MLKNEICTDSEPTKPTELKKETLVGLVGSKSRVFQKKSGRWLSLIEPENSLVGSELVQKEKRNKPKVWRLKIRSSDGKRIDAMTMIDPHRLTDEECKEHLARQIGESRIVSFEQVS